jgi:hypothetical protein
VMSDEKTQRGRGSEGDGASSFGFGLTGWRKRQWLVTSG